MICLTQPPHLPIKIVETGCKLQVVRISSTHGFEGKAGGISYSAGADGYKQPVPKIAEPLDEDRLAVVIERMAERWVLIAAAVLLIT